MIKPIAQPPAPAPAPAIEAAGPGYRVFGYEPAARLQRSLSLRASLAAPSRLTTQHGTLLSPGCLSAFFPPLVPSPRAKPPLPGPAAPLALLPTRPAIYPCTYYVTVRIPIPDF